MFKLRDYQEQAVVDAMRFMDSPFTSGLIVQPTGAGKSLIVANIAEKLGQPVLVIQPSKELLVQNYQKFISYGGRAAICSASMGVKGVSRITFGTPGTLVSQIDRLRRVGIKAIVVDEAHIGGKKDNNVSKIAKSLGVNKIIGLTATPVVLKATMNGSVIQMLNRTRDSVYKKIIHVTQIEKMVKEGYWADLYYGISKTNTSMLIPNSTGADFTTKSIERFYSSNNVAYKILRSIEMARDMGVKSILVFVPSVEAAKELSLKISSSACVYGDMPKIDRDRIVSAFKLGKIKVVFNVNVLGVGFDFPELDTIIHARPTGSINMYYQHIGRVVRPHEGKEKAYVFDLCGNFDRFGDVRSFRFEKHPEKGWRMMSGDKQITGVEALNDQAKYAILARQRSYR